MTRQELKEWSKNKMKGHMWKVLGAVVITGLISGLTAEIDLKNEFLNFSISLGFTLIGFIISIGLVEFMVNYINDKNYDYEMLFSKFSDWKRILLTYFHIYIRVFAWCLLLIIPGIIKAYSYSMVPYILQNDKDISPVDALKLSEEIMNGHKMDLFILELSFIGWHLLAIPTLMILEVWIIPYQQTALTKYMYDLKTNHKKNILKEA